MKQLKIFLEKEYNFRINELSEAERGFYGETWIVISENKKYFLKIVYFPVHKSRYEKSFSIVEYMNENGINFISKIVRAVDGALYKHFENGIFGIFEFVEGVHTEDYDLSDLFGLLAKIYKLDTKNLNIEKETFGLFYSEQFDVNMDKLKKLGNCKTAKAQKILCENIKLIEKYKRELTRYSEIIIVNANDFFITSGDVGGNVIVSDLGLTVIDWDYLILAPLERDIWPYLHDEELIGLVDKALENNGIDYRVSKKRLAFYCYKSYFYYLHEYMCGLIEFNQNDQIIEKITNDLEEYFRSDSWVNKNVQIVEKYDFF